MFFVARPIGISWLCWRAEHGKNRKRIDARVVDSNGPVEMGTGDAPRRADGSYDVATFDRISFTDVDYRKMRKQRKQAKTMIDDDRIAREVQIAGQDDAAAVRRTHRCSGGAEEVCAAVRSTRLPV